MRGTLAVIQKDLFERARKFRDDNTFDAGSWEELVSTVAGRGGIRQGSLVRGSSLRIKNQGGNEGDDPVYPFRCRSDGRCVRVVRGSCLAPAGVRACVLTGTDQLRPPRSCRRRAEATSAAVSVLSLRTPSETAWNPASCARATSPSLNPPSGPTQMTARPPAQWRAGSRGMIACSCGMSFSAPGPKAETNSGRGTGPSTRGRTHRPDCFIAATQSFCHRSVLAFRRIVRSVRSGTIRTTPISARFLHKVVEPRRVLEHSRRQRDAAARARAAARGAR